MSNTSEAVSSPVIATTWSAVDRRALGLIVLVALILRVGYVLACGDDPPPEFGDRYFYSLTAQNLLAGDGYVEIHARAYRPPGYAWFLAGIYSLFGTGPTAARLALALLGAGHCLLQAAWVGRLAGVRAGLVAAGITAIYPQFVRFPQTMYTETLFVFLQALALFLLLVALQGRSWWRLVLAGVVCGLSVLTREMGMILIAAAGLWFLLVRDRLPAPVVRRWLVFTGAALLVVGCWTVRNYRVLGAVVPVSTSTGINLHIGNNPEANGTFVWATAPSVDWNDGAGELSAHREGLRAAVAYAWSHPGRTAELAARKLWYLWRLPLYRFAGLSPLQTAIRGAYLLAYAALLAIPLLGWRVLRRNWPAVALPLLVLLLANLAHMASFAGTRFRVPLAGFLIYFSAVAVADWWSRRRAIRPSDTSPTG